MGAETRTSAGDKLAASVLTFLRRYPPFDKLEPDALEFMAGRLALGYYPKDTVVLAPDRGPPAFFYIIQRGLVHISPEENNPGAAREVLALGPGECFSVGALLEKRPVTVPYVAAAATFCYPLTAEGRTDAGSARPGALSLIWVKAGRRPLRSIGSNGNSAANWNHQELGRPSL